MKTISYGIMHFIIAFSVSYIMSGSFALASAIALIEPIIQTFAYFIHEKVWFKIQNKPQKLELTQPNNFIVNTH